MTSEKTECPDVPVSDSHADNSNAIDRLRKLTEQFRSSLQYWLDPDGKPNFVELEGATVPLLRVEAMTLRGYAKEYTRIWTEQPDGMKKEMRWLWFIDCRTLYIDEPWWSGSKRRDWAPVRFDGSVIDVRYLFNGERFLGFASFVDAKFIGDADFEGSEFRGSATFDGASFSRDIRFPYVKFFELASFMRIRSILGSVDFSNASFCRAPLLHESKLPQGTSFDEATFDVARQSLSQQNIADDARAFRTLKQVAASYRGQQDEADFFALEQRYRRIAFLAPRLVWDRKSWRNSSTKQGLLDVLNIDNWREWKEWSIRWRPVEWFISIAYDWISGYGRYPGRALFCFVIVTIVAALLYAYAFAFGDCASTADYCAVKTSNVTFASKHPAISFALQNLLNPSALVSERALVIARNPVMIFVGVVQFICSYIILVLMALSVRSRFQKSGGGDK